jgi:2-polyprenyl-3-methyl-5-hydroxy-6-metoxy-1,4-benzoquinol methylase
MKLVITTPRPSNLLDKTHRLDFIRQFANDEINPNKQYPAQYYNSLLLSMLNNVYNEGEKILDVGCSFGTLGREFLKLHPNSFYMGIEPEPLVAKCAKNFLSDIFQGTIEEFLSVCQTEFDLIVFGDVLEHLVNPWKVIKNCQKVLSPQGKIIASVPNVFSFEIFLQLVSGQFYYNNSGVFDITHLRFFTLETFCELFEQADLQVCQELTLGAVYQELSDLAKKVSKIQYPLTIVIDQLPFPIKTRSMLEQLLCYQFAVCFCKPDYENQSHQLQIKINNNLDSISTIISSLKNAILEEDVILAKEQILALVKSRTGFDESQIKQKIHEKNLRILAWYLPQFHPIPENDKNWGKGFTEWRNVTKAYPMFKEHHQPHLPSDLGFYDLRLSESRIEQAKLARKYGIDGFIYHYYWFSGKKLLEKPIEDMLKLAEPNFPFCINWANENWTRRWDGLENEIIVEQKHSLDSDLNFIREILPFLLDERYIKIEGKPLLSVYRPELLDCPEQVAQGWNKIVSQQGISSLYLAEVRNFGKNNLNQGFDCLLDFPPHNTKSPPLDISSDLLNPLFQGKVFDYKGMIFNSIVNPDIYSFAFMRGIMPRWDNTPRKLEQAYLWYGSTPKLFEIWLYAQVIYSVIYSVTSEAILTINAWNEWAEGAHLEPDLKFKHEYLQAVLNVKNQLFI